MPISSREREKYILDRLYKSLGAGWDIVDADRESPDGLIRGPDGEVGVELCRCHRHDASDAAVDYAQQMRSDAVPDWLNDPSVHHWHVRWEYREENGKKVLVPRPDERRAFIEELKKLVRWNEGANGTTNAVVRFSDDSPRRRRNPNPKRRVVFVDKSDYPTLYKHITCTRLYHGGDAVFGLHADSLQCGAVGLDIDEFRRKVADKYERLPVYQSNLSSVPIWLVFYNDGDAITRSIIPRFHLREAARVLEDIERDQADQFDRVLWGVDVMLSGSETGHFYDLRSDLTCVNFDGE